MFSGLVAAKPLPTQSVGVEIDSSQNCNGLRCVLGTQLCRYCCKGETYKNGQRYKDGDCIPQEDIFVCKCRE